VVGVVVGKLDAIAVARGTGDIPQNVNFAVNAALARLFLQNNGVEYKSSPLIGPSATAEIAERIKKITVAVECWKSVEKERRREAEKELLEERGKLEAERRALEGERRRLEGLAQESERVAREAKKPQHRMDSTTAAIETLWRLVTADSKLVDVRADYFVVSVDLCRERTTTRSACKEFYKANAAVRFRDVREVYFRNSPSLPSPFASLWTRGADISFYPLYGPRPDELSVRLYVRKAKDLRKLRDALEQLVRRPLSD